MYIKAVFEVVEFEVEDVITTSSDTNNNSGTTIDHEHIIEESF